MITKAERNALRKLGDKQTRDLTGLFVVEGRKLLDEVLCSELEVVEIFTTEPTREEGYRVISEVEMGQISQLKTPTTHLATVRQPHYDIAMADPSKNLVLALDCVQNPGNLGTILRVADWFGISDVVCSADCADAFNPKVVQATMGAILRTRIHYTDLAKWLAGQRRRGAEIYGTKLDGEPIYTTSLAKTGVIVMGNEGRGIGEECSREITQSLLIPSVGDSHGESLNVAIATAIVCAEFRRPR